MVGTTREREALCADVAVAEGLTGSAADLRVTSLMPSGMLEAAMEALPPLAKLWVDLSVLCRGSTPTRRDGHP